MKQCERCKEVKYWFQFYTIDEIEYSTSTTLCKKCAKIIEIDAILEFINFK